MKISRAFIYQTGIWLGLGLCAYFVGSTRGGQPNFSVVLLRVFWLATYTNVVYYLLFPLYLGDKKRLFIGLSLVAYACFVGLILVFAQTEGIPEEIRQQFPPGAPVPAPRYWVILLLPPIVMGILLFGLAASLHFFSAYEKKKQEEAEANRRRIEAELALLKSQINPHFLLNTLNNLNALALTAPEKTPDALQRLSEMVRFILHECTQPTVSLAEDLRFIENYLSLQRLRLPPNVRLRVEMPHPETMQGSIEPMILIPFIENPFKHGLTTQRACDIFVSIQRLRNNLVLQVENDLILSKNTADTAISGMGLANTRQRLEHAFPGQHLLQIEEKEGKYRVELTLILEK